jgi:hypothetical protein
LLTPPPENPPQASDLENGIPREPVHSFIVKVFLEQREGRLKHTAWHGQVTHVPSGERRSVRNLADVCVVISRYLEAWGVRIQPLHRLARSIYTRFIRPGL